MYKTVSIQQNSYQALNRIASRLDKPKAQVIDALVKAYTKEIAKKEKKELKEYNAKINKLAKHLAQTVRVPKGTRIDLTDIDRDFAYLEEKS